MNANLITYTEEGKTISKKKVRVYFASSSKPPIICIELPMNKNNHVEVYISAKELLGLILGRVLEKLAG